MFSLSPRRYRQSTYSFQTVELCRYMTGGYNCNDIICIDSSDFCRSHYNGLERVILQGPPINRNLPILSNNIIINSNNIDILRRRNMNNDIVIDINDNNILDDDETSEEDIETSVIIKQLQKQKIKDVFIKNCHICYKKINYPLVELQCKCKFHLKCYSLLKNETHCINCNDKIYKTSHDLKKCSICLTKIKDSKIKLHCKHEYHNECLQEWILNGQGDNTNNCPLCREKIKLKID